MGIGSESILSVKNVTKYFFVKKPVGKIFKIFNRYKKEKVKVLDKVSFEVKQGEKVAFIGPNGAGKSTTIKCILGILYPDEGEIEVLGKNPVKNREDVAKEVSSVFGQRSQLLYHLPLIESFKFFKVIYQIPDHEFQDRLDKLVKKFKISDFIYIPVRKLSLGQRMKGEIVASLLHGPKAIFLDEPTVGLDVVSKKVLYETLLQIHAEENITIFLTSHDIGDVQALCERSIIINKGKILFDGLLEDLLKRYADKKIIKYRYVGDFDWKIEEIENDVEMLQSVVKKILQNGKLEDLVIEDIPLEEIIIKFYN